MSSPYTQPSISGYNSNPPEDDGSEVASNEVKWQTHLDKIGGPLKTFAEAVDANVLAAFALLPFRTVSAISSNTTVTTSDRGKHYVCTSTFTLTLPAAADATDSFVISGQNTGTGVITIDGNASETINGVVTVDISSGASFVLVCDGSNWTAITGARPWVKGADIASVAALTVAIDGNYFDITGTTTVTSLAAKGIGSLIKLHFDDALTLTHHATNLILPGGANITTAAGDEAEFFEYGAGTWRCTNYQRAAQSPGQHVVQMVHTSDGAVATTTTVLPVDDTIPQNNEGGEFMTLAITPKNTSNRLLIRVEIQVASSAAGYTMAAALFQDSTADALAAVHMTGNGANEMMHLSMNHEMAAGTTSATTFKIRAGTAQAGTTTFNGSAGARQLGGVSSSTITIMEISA